MTVTPDTQFEAETDENFVEALEEAFAVAESDDGIPEGASLTDLFMEHLQPALAAIRRQAAADALNARAKSFDASARLFRDMAAGRDAKDDPMSARIYTAHATQAGTDANACRTEADAVIASGYEWQCASGTGCCSPVPDAGDLCKECEANEYDDRWAE
ncbi:hypothetical protein Jinkies_55 [Arthrobacter phage Jinkies]|uniref:Uncharacterized protein n=1 Tax=Arthrobacter phage Jinkies TaxID=2743903 RepID=A0A7S5WWF2_9CAUD|nr:hypothetical protein Jinkies_55 [Arthrobacter phage Jinkies]